MRIGVIADIHANLAALEAVLEAMPAVDRLLCCGDLVGYYAEPNEVCERVRAIGAYCVRGNHDGYITGCLDADPAKARLFRTEWTRRRLSERNLAWLRSLPVERRFHWGSCRLLLRHASPWDEKTYLYRDSPACGRLALDAGEVLLVGHTHHPLIQPAGEGLLLNPGSVGQPRDWDPRASFALLETDSRAVEIGRVGYEHQAYQARLRARGWEEAVIAILGRERRSSE